MFIFLRLIHFFRNGFVKNLSFIDKFITDSNSRFEIYQNKIKNKIIKFNSNKIRIIFNTLIKNKYFKFLFSLKYLKKKTKKKLKTVYFYLNLYNFYIQYLKFINYSIYIDANSDIIDNRRYNKINKIFNLLELDGKNLIESLLVVDGKIKNKHNFYKNLKKKKQLFGTRIMKLSLDKKVIKNRICFFVSETNICDKTGILSNINNKTYSLYTKIYNLFEFKLNSVKNKLNLNKIKVNIFYNLKKNINLKVLYFNSFNFVEILHILSFKDFKESNIMLFCLSIFCELMYICFNYIIFFKIEFINIIQICLDLINLYKFEIFSFLEFMCIQTFKRDYFINQLLILSIIKQFLNDNKFLINFFLKYYNTCNVYIIKFLYTNNFSKIIEILRGSCNIFLNLTNSFIKTFFNNFILLKYSIYPLNIFLNLNYYLKSFNYKFNNIFKRALNFHNNKVIQINNDNLDLIRPTPLKFKVSIETLSDKVQNSSKRGRPRKLSIYQKDILIGEGVLEPSKPLTEKQLYENEWGVSYEFAKDNSDFIKNLSDYISTRDKNYKKKEQKISKISIDKSIEKYYIQPTINNNEFLTGPIVFSEESINAALAFARELMIGFKMQDSVKLKILNKNNNNIEKKRNGRPYKNNPIRTIKKIYVSVGRLKFRKYYTEIVNENKN